MVLGEVGVGSLRVVEAELLGQGCGRGVGAGGRDAGSVAVLAGQVSVETSDEG